MFETCIPVETCLEQESTVFETFCALEEHMPLAGRKQGRKEEHLLYNMEGMHACSSLVAAALGGRKEETCCALLPCGLAETSSVASFLEASLFPHLMMEHTLGIIHNLCIVCHFDTTL